VGDARHVKKIVHYHRWELRTPSNCAELDKAVTWAAQKFREQFGRSIEYDDDLKLGVEDDMIVIWFEVAS
jgi:hypothetical protein